MSNLVKTMLLVFDNELTINHTDPHQASFVTELGETRKAQYAFRHMSCPTLSLMCFTKLMVFDENFEIDHTEWLKAAFATELGATRKACYTFRHISCPTWSITKPNVHCAQDHCCCDKSWGKPGKPVMLSDTCHVRPCPWWAKQMNNLHSDQITTQFSMCSLVV